MSILFNLMFAMKIFVALGSVPLLIICIKYLNGINFRELENFAFREDLLSRIGYAENFREY